MVKIGKISVHCGDFLCCFEFAMFIDRDYILDSIWTAQYDPRGAMQ